MWKTKTKAMIKAKYDREGIFKMTQNYKNNNNNMTVEEAGQKGGNQAARNHDKEFYEEIGQKGGNERGRQQQSNNNSNS